MTAHIDVHTLTALTFVRAAGMTRRLQQMDSFSVCLCDRPAACVPQKRLTASM